MSSSAISSSSSGEPRVRPPASAEVGLLQSVNAVQHAAKVAACVEAVTAETSSAWSAVTKSSMGELWSKHFSLLSLQWVATLAGVPHEGATKAALVDALTGQRVRPVSIDVLTAAVSGWKDAQRESDPLLFSPPGANASGSAPGASAAAASAMMPPPAPSGPAAAPSGPAMGGNGGTSGQRLPAAQGLELASALGALGANPRGSNTAAIEVLSRVVEQNSKAMAVAAAVLAKLEANGLPPRDSEPEEKELVLPLDKHYAEIDGRLVRHLFVDPMQLADGVVQKLKFKIPGQKAKSQRIGDLVLSSDVDDTKTGHWFDPDGMEQGFLRLITRVMGLESEAHRAPDMLKLSQKVWGFEKGTRHGKAKFLKHFLYNHAASNDLCGEFDRDLDLKLVYLLSSGPNSAADGKRKASGSGSRPDGSGKRRREKSGKKCFTRLDPSKGKCFHKDCIFDHSCVSCGGDHAAVDCKDWDPAKGKRSMETALSRLRSGSASDRSSR